MKRLFHLSITICCLILSTNANVFAGTYSLIALTPNKSALGTVASLTIVDPKYANQMSWVGSTSPAPNQTIVDGGPFETSRLLKVRLAYGRQGQSDRPMPNPISSQWRVTVTYSEIDNVTNVHTDNNSISISYSNGNPVYESINTHLVSSGNVTVYNIIVQYTDPTSTTTLTSSNVPDDIQLEAILETTEYSTMVNNGTLIEGNFNTTTYPSSYNTTNQPGIFLSGLSGNHELITWSFIQGAESYDLEYVYIDAQDASYSGALASSIDPFTVNDPVRINTTDNYYTLDMTYPSGVIFFRVRGVGHFTKADGAANPSINVNNGVWNKFLYGGSTPASAMISSSFEGDKTWELVKSYAEGGKNKKVITYYDETSRARQSLTNLSTNNTVAVAEKKYDYEGRPTVSILPFPVQGIDLSYLSTLELNTSTSSVFSKSDFDNGSSITTHPTIATSSGAGQYYSSNMPSITGAINQNYTPNAGGYPYTQVLYDRDNRNRPVRQSGVGPDHALYGAHDTKYYYETAKDGELYRLFGSNVGNVSHYKKNYVQDANGQLSTSYLDQEGRTIATALAGASPNNVNTLPEYSTNQVTANLATNNIFDPNNQTITSVNEQTNTIVGSNYTFSYNLNDVLITGTPCMTCTYQLAITIKDPHGNDIIGNTDTSGSISISSATIVGNAIVQNYAFEIQAGVPSLVPIYSSGSSPTIIGYNTLWTATSSCPAPTGNPSGPLTFAATFNEIGSYTITKVLSVVQPSQSQAIAAVLADPANQTLLDTVGILQTLLANTNFSICNVTCEQQCNNDPTCVANCQKSYAMQLSDSVVVSGCDGYWAQMKAEMSPGGIYYEWWISSLTGNGGVRSMYATTAPCSDMNPIADNIAAIVPIDVTHSDTLFRLSDGTLFASTQALIDSLQDSLNFQSDWGDTLVRWHPEYCHYTMCKLLSASGGSNDYDNKMAAAADLTTFSGYVSSGYVGSSDPILGVSYNSTNFSSVTLSSYNLTPQGCAFTAGGSDPSVGSTSSIPSNQTFSAAISHYVNMGLIPTSGQDLYSQTAPPDAGWFITTDQTGALTSGTLSQDPLYAYRQGLYNGMGSATQAALDQRHWVIYRGAYSQLKQQYINAFTAQICTTGCQVNGFIPDSLSFAASSSSNTATSNPNLTNTPYSFTVFPNPNYGTAELAASISSGGVSCFGTTSSTAAITAANNVAQEANSIMISKIVGDCINYCHNDNIGGEWMQQLFPNGPAIDTIVTAPSPYLLPLPLCESGFLQWQATGMTHQYILAPTSLYNTVVSEMDSFCTSQCYALITYSNTANDLTQSSTVRAAAQQTLQNLLTASPGVYVPTIDNSNIDYQSVYSPEPPQLSTTLNYLLSSSSLTTTCVFPNANCTDRVYYWMGQVGALCDGLTINDTAAIERQLSGLCASTSNVFNNNFQLTSSLLQTLYNNHNTYVDSIEIVMNSHGCSILGNNNTIGEGFTNACNVSPCFSTMFIGAFNSLTGNGSTWLQVSSDGNSILIASNAMDSMNNCMGTAGNIWHHGIEAFPSIPTSTKPSCLAFSFFKSNGTQLSISSVSSFNYYTATLAGNPLNVTPAGYNYLGFYAIGTVGTIYDTIYFFQKLDVTDCNINFVKCDWSLSNWSNDCIAYLNEQAEYTTQALFQERLDSLVDVYMDRYKLNCFSNPPQEVFNMTYYLAEYHYTLYYYDQAGNLVQTVPPEGVYPINATQIANIQNNTYTQADQPQHLLLTRYQYNSLNQVINQTTPDGGTTVFWYNDKGQLRLSQNAKQLAANTFSFTKYDAQGRIVKVGEAQSASSSDPPASPSDPATIALLSDTGYSAYPSLLTMTESTTTFYDAPQTSTCGTQENLRGRVSEVYTSEGTTQLNTTAYSYDPHGNVQTLYQSGGELTCSEVDYQYDLISGKVNEVDFYNDIAELEFHHKYDYDADNRITNVYTSHDGIVWDEDAQYFYYPHGPLARTEIGEDKVQGLDYYYTIHGWLKGVNMPGSYPDQNYAYTTTPATYDPGLDGYNNTINSLTAQDQLSYQLGYYTGDYTAANTGAGSNILSLNVPVNNILPASSSQPGLFNGNITAMATDIPYMANANVAADRVVAHNFQYDQLNRINNSYYNNYTGTAWVSGGNKFATSYTYDMNGNIRTLNRYDKAGAQFDQLAYNYPVVGGTLSSTGRLATSNQLQYVADPAVDLNVTTDIQNQTTTNNYQYDGIGNLVSDASENLIVTWNVYGKISNILKGASAPYTYMAFTYDGSGNRTTKYVGTVSSGIITWTDKTTYVRDASGNIMCTYDDKLQTPNIGSSFWNQTIEYPIYGSSRVGMYTATVNNGPYTSGSTDVGTYQRVMRQKDYELSDHLGNVMAVVTDWKIGVSDPTNTNLLYYTSDVASASDYYPFGMHMPGRHYHAHDYRFGFNGKEMDNEVNGNGNEYDFGARIYDNRLARFLSIDPLWSQFPWNSPYSFASNSPIAQIDKEGMQTDYYMLTFHNGKAQLKLYQQSGWLVNLLTLGMHVIKVNVPSIQASFTFMPTSPSRHTTLPCAGCGTGNSLADFEEFKKDPVAALYWLKSDQVVVGEMVKEIIVTLLIGRALSLRNTSSTTDLSGSKFAQTKINRAGTFSKEGIEKYSQLAGRPINTTDDLTAAIRSGAIKPNQIPLDYVVINGQKVILNTRTAAALNDAGIPMSKWTGVDRTGVAVPGLESKGVKFEDLAKDQIKRNYKKGESLSSTPPSAQNK